MVSSPATAALLLCAAPAGALLLGCPLARRAAAPPRMAAWDELWDGLLHGSKGKPAPRARATVKDLRGVFEQWDVDGSGELELEELERAFRAVGLGGVDFAACFAALDADGSGGVTYAEFEDGLPPSLRATIESRLNEEGVMESLYVPPEQWSEDETAKEVAWERKVQWQAQREGNALKQNDILQDQLGQL